MIHLNTVTLNEPTRYFIIVIYFIKSIQICITINLNNYMLVIRIAEKKILLIFGII